MEIPSLLYLCFWALVSVLAITSVDILLNKLDQFSSHSSELQQILHTFLCFSFSRVFIFNPSFNSRLRRVVQPEMSLTYWYLIFQILVQFVVIKPESSIILILRLLSTSLVFFVLKSLFQPVSTVSIYFFHWRAWAIYTAFASIIYQNVHHTIKIDKYKSILPLYVGFIIACLLSLYQSKLQSFVTLKVPLSLKIIVGLIGHILANHFLKDKSFILFWLVVSLAIFWLGNLAMLQSSCPGIFEFLVGAILDIAGELFGLNIYMWLIGFGCAVLFIFFEHLDKFDLRYPGVGGADDHETRIEGPSRGRERGQSSSFSQYTWMYLIFLVLILLVKITMDKLLPPESATFESFANSVFIILLPVTVRGILSGRQHEIRAIWSGQRSSSIWAFGLIETMKDLILQPLRTLLTWVNSL